MERKEYGWCDHLQVRPFYRAGGSTALYIDHGEPIVLWWLTQEVCVVYCRSCYMKESGLSLAESGSLPILGPRA